MRTVRYLGGRHLLALIAVGIVSACAHDPVSVARGPELKAQALFAEFTIAEQRAAALMQSAEVPDAVKAEIQAFEKKAAPIAEKMEAKRTTIADLEVSAPAEIPQALQALNELIAEAAPLIHQLDHKTKQEGTADPVPPAPGETTQ